MMIESSTLTDHLDRIAALHPEKRLNFPSTHESLTLAELASESRKIGGALVEQGVAPGDLVGLILPTSRDFVCSYFGIMRAGAVVAPLAPPTSSRGVALYLERTSGIIRDAGMRHLILGSALGSMLPENALPGVAVLTPDRLKSSIAPEVDLAKGGESLVMVQYTSGSTSLPKGVALSNANLLAGIQAIIVGAKLSERDVNVQWLPLCHDMGLIGMLACMAVGAEQHIWSPASFIKHPGRWLVDFARVRGSIYAGPSFSYGYMLAEVDEAQLAEMDLSSWRVAFNAAEPIDVDVMTRFQARFATVGLRPAAMFPVYGLAEITLPGTFPSLDEMPVIRWFDRDGLASECQVSGVASDHPKARGLVSIGRAVHGHALRVVGPDGVALPEGRVGEISLRGPAVMQGYYQKPELTQATLRDGWLHTGDLGFIRDGNLFICGRLKELIIIRGRKIYPMDVEMLVRPLPGVFRDCAIAFDLGAERLAVLIETAVSDGAEQESLHSLARTRLTEQLGIDDFDLHLIKPRTIQHTTSGKPQRLLMRKQLQAGDLRDQMIRSFASPTEGV